MHIAVTFPSNMAEATLLKQVAVRILEQAVLKQAIWNI
jgi:hypothetical protein